MALRFKGMYFSGLGERVCSGSSSNSNWPSDCGVGRCLLYAVYLANRLHTVNNGLYTTVRVARTTAQAAHAGYMRSGHSLTNRLLPIFRHIKFVRWTKCERANIYSHHRIFFWGGGGGGNKFYFIFTPIYWREKINLNLFSLPFIG